VAAGVDEDAGGGGGVAVFFDQSRIDALGAMEFLRDGGEGVAADGSDETRGGAGARGGDGLVRALAAGAGDEFPERRLAGRRKMFGQEREILHITADNDDVGLHRAGS